MVTSCPNGSALMIVRPVIFLFALIVGSSLLCFVILFKLPTFQDVPFFTFPDTTVATTIFLALGAKVGRVNIYRNRIDQQFCIYMNDQIHCSWVNCLGSECSSGITNSSLPSSSSISSTSSPESSCPSSSELRFLRDTKIKQPANLKNVPAPKLEKMFFKIMCRAVNGSEMSNPR